MGGSRWILGLGCCLALAGLHPRPAVAQLIEEIELTTDNDGFNFWVPTRDRPDYEYTHGTRLTLRARTARGWGRRLAAGHPVCDGTETGVELCLLTEWELGQQIYTPRTNSERVVEGERPYAGWLYGAVTATSQRDLDRQRLRLELGVTGPPSLAGTLQTTVHELAGFWTPLGWDEQLEFEPGVVVGYGYDRVLGTSWTRGVRVAELTSLVDASVGNVVTGAAAGLNARVGYNVPHSWSDHLSRQQPTVSVYLTAGVLANAYLRNLFLDGSSSGGGPQVKKLPLVPEYLVGLAVRLHRVDLAFRVVSRARAYRTEPGGHTYSSIGVTLQR